MRQLVIDADYLPYFAASSTEVEQRYYIVQEEDGAPPLATFDGKTGKKDAIGWAVNAGLSADNVVQCREVVDESRLYEILEATLEEILTFARPDAYCMYLGGPENYRKALYENYKTSRKKYLPPLLLDKAKKYMVDHMRTSFTDGIEADDAVAIHHLELMKDGHESILGTCDKDLDQIHGIHLDLKNLRLYEVSEDYAEQFLYQQIITGDAVDDIPGVYRYGPVRAQKALQNCTTPKEMWDVACKLHGSVDSANLTANLVYILRSDHDYWSPPE